VIDDYVRETGVAITPAHEADNLAMAISLVASRRGFALLPRYAQNFLPWSVVSRPIKGNAPSIDLVIGYHRGNASPILKQFLSKLHQLRVGRHHEA
jgi:LysR family hca operon transcriptional activator